MTGAGGIAGWNSRTVTGCNNYGDVSADYSAGGIVGFNYGGTVADCKNSGDVTATGSSGYAGGIAAVNQDGTVDESSCYNYGTVTAANIRTP